MRWQVRLSTCIKTEVVKGDNGRLVGKWLPEIVIVESKGHLPSDGWIVDGHDVPAVNDDRRAMALEADYVVGAAQRYAMAKHAGAQVARCYGVMPLGALVQSIYSIETTVIEFYGAEHVHKSTIEAYTEEEAVQRAANEAQAANPQATVLKPHTVEVTEIADRPKRQAKAKVA